MAKRKKQSGSIRKKKKGGKRPLLGFLVVLGLVALVLYGLETLKKHEISRQPEEGSSVVRHPMPQRPLHQEPLLPDYTTAVSAVRPPKHARPSAAAGGAVAVLIDDMGTTVQEAKQLMSIGVPLTISIIPDRPQAKSVAETFYGGGHEVMIHMPMEPADYPKRRLESNGLLVAQSDAEITKRLKSYLQQVPNAVGANNHMGSRFTENDGKMRVVLGFLKSWDLFFVDSVTSSRSVGAALSREIGLKTASRNVFLDNVQDVGAIKEQLRQLARTASRNGSAIGICHPHKATLQALAEELPQLKRQGVKFVYISQLVK